MLKVLGEPVLYQMMQLIWLDILNALLWLMAVADVKKLIEKTNPRQIGAAIENFLKTGRLATQSGLDLKQVLK